MCWGNVQRTNRSSFYTYACTHTQIYIPIPMHAYTCVYLHLHTDTYMYIHSTNALYIHCKHATYIQTLCTSKYKFNSLWFQFFLWQSFFAYKIIHLPYELKPRQEQSDPFGQQVQGMPSQEGLDLCGHAYQTSTMWEQNNEKRRRSKLKSYIQFDPSRIICEGHMLFDRMGSSVQAPLGTRRVLEWNTNL